MLDFPDAPIIGDVYADRFRWDGIKWMGLPSSGGSMSVSDDAPLMDGAANAGALMLYQRGDHVHPHDTSRAPLIAASLTGMSADSVTATTFGSISTTYVAGGHIVSQNADDGGYPSVGCYSWDRGYVMGIMLDPNNRIGFGNMYGDGTPAANNSNIDVGGNLYLATTMLVSRDPSGALDVATKNYVDTRSIAGAYMPLAGGQMQGQFTSHYSQGSLNGGGPLSIEVRGNSGDAYITFHRTGHFACNFGCSGDWNMWFGGWSFGAGAAYRFWTTRDFGGLPVTDSRLAFCTDLAHGAYSGLQENWGGALITGSSGYNGQGLGSYTIVIRYRYFQLLTNGWYTVGYA